MIPILSILEHYESILLWVIPWEKPWSTFLMEDPLINHNNWLLHFLLSVSAHSEGTVVHSLPGTRPSSRLSVEPPTFEVEPVATPTDGATTPKRVEVPDEFPYPGLEETKRPGLLERALSVLKRSKSQVPQDSIFSSAVGFYAAHATMLAAAIIGESCRVIRSTVV